MKTVSKRKFLCRCWFVVLTVLVSSVSVAQIQTDTLQLPGGYLPSLLRLRTDMIARPNGEIWISFVSLGVLHYNGSVWVNYDPLSTSNQLPSGQVHKLCLDSSGAVWMANSMSLTRMDANGFKNYFFTVPYNYSSDPITDLVESQGKILMSTRHGLNVLDTLTSVWQFYNTQNSALPNDTINSLFAEPAGPVWISTKFGYAKYNQNNIVAFTPPGNGFSHNEVLSMAVTAHDTLVALGNDHLYRKSGINWLNLDSVYIGYPEADLWCDSLSFGELEWHGRSFDFITGLVVNSDNDVLMLRYQYPNIGVFVVKANKSFNYSWAYSDNYLYTVADFYKSDSILIGGGMASTFLRIVESPDLGNYMVCSPQTSFLAPYQVDFEIPPSYKGSPIETLQGNMITSTVLNCGDWGWNPISQTPLYNVPRGSGKNTVYAGSIWLGGYDQGGNLYTAAMAYRQNSSQDFQPGPLDTAGNTDSVTTALFDHLWMTRKSDIDEFRYQFAVRNVTNGTYPVPQYILDWPAYYNYPAYPQKLAPFVDVNADDVYDPYAGDYPDIRGDQMAWWVFNDNRNKTQTNSPSMHVEVNASAYAANCMDAPDVLGRILSYTTFYHFDVYNRGSLDFDSCYFGVWSDFDLGNASDDYVGSNLSANSFFVYNGDTDDDGGGGYGVCPPSQSVSFLKGPEAPLTDGLDNDHNGLVDEANEELGLSGFTFYVNVNNMPTGNPFMTDDYYQYLSGSWLDGYPFTYGGDGRGGGIGATNVPTKFMFPDTSDLNFSAPWTMQGAQIQPDDMRGVGSFGPFDLPAGSFKSFDVAYVTGPNDLVQNHELVRQLRNAFRNGILNSFHSSLPAIQGPAQITTSGSSVNYLLPYQSAVAQYLWTVTNGLILSGQGTNEITVSWGAGGAGEVMVEVLDPANPCGMHQRLTVTIGSQGFGQVANEITARIYPNPTRHQLQIETADAHITTYSIRSSTGQLLLQKAFEGTCDVSTLAPGMYFLELKDERGVVLVRKMFVRQ
ncbi:MAG: T9SS type A sorting domain-containing protein [Bacteroidia bacterium]